jgi:hypothetical protein
MKKEILDNRIVAYTDFMDNPMSLVDEINNLQAKHNLKFVPSTINNYEEDHSKITSTSFWLHEHPTDYTIGPEFVKDKKKVNEKIDRAIFEPSIDYVKSFSPGISMRERWGLVKYEDTEFLTWHTDGDTKNNRKVSFVFYVNDDYTGGEIEFKNFIGSPYKPKAGTLLMFPSYPEYLHRVIPVVSGTKYVFISFAV